MAPAALSAPTFAASKYGLLICFGMNVTESAPDALPPADADAAGADAAGTGAAGAEAAASDALAVGVALDPHAPTARLAVAKRAAIRPNRREINSTPPRVSCGDHLTRAANRGCRAVPTSLRSVDGGLDPASKRGNDHRHDQEQPDSDALDVGGHVRQPQDVPQHGQREEGEDDAGDRAPAAEDVDAAEEHDRHDDEREPGPDVRSGTGHPRDEDDPGQRRHDTRQDEQEQLEPRDADPRAARGGLILADRVQLAADPRAVEEDRQDDGTAEVDGEGPGDREARQAAEPEAGEPVREVADAARSQHHEGETAEERERP